MLYKQIHARQLRQFENIIALYGPRLTKHRFLFLFFSLFFIDVPAEAHPSLSTLKNIITIAKLDPIEHNFFTQMLLMDPATLITESKKLFIKLWGQNYEGYNSVLLDTLNLSKTLGINLITN